MNPYTAVLTYSISHFIVKFLKHERYRNGATYYGAIEALAFEENE
jgi:hypothetical protein